MGLTDRIGGRRVYFDANVFIYAVERVSPYAEPLRPFVEAVGRNATQAVTSELTLAEVLVKPLRDGPAGLQAEYELAVQSRAGLTVVPISRAVLVEAARLRAAFSTLKLPDAIHAATARLHGCAVLLTNDARLRAAPGIDVIQLSDIV